MRTNIRLDSFFASSSTGMDLVKGVPAGKSDARSSRLKDEVSFEKSFEDQMKDLQKDVPESKDSVPRQGSTDASNQVEKPKHKDVRKAEAAPSEAQGPVKADEGLAGRQSADVADLEGLPLEEQVISDSAVVEELPVEEDSNPSLPMIALPVQVMTETPAPSQQVTASAISPQSEKRASQSHALSGNLSSDAKDGSVEIPSELSEVVDSALVIDLEKTEVDISSAESMGGLQATELEPAEKAQPIKDFAAELWIHRNVDAESKLTSKSELSIQFDQDASPQKPLSMGDLKPLISKLVTTKTGGEMNLQMRPEHLGMVKVEILAEGDAVRVNLFAEKASAQSALNSQVNDLKQQLSAVGLKVEAVTVSTLQSSSSEQSRNNQSDQQSKHQQENSQQRPQQQSAQQEFEMDAWNEEVA